jgi:copper chaperone CopZ
VSVKQFGPILNKVGGVTGVHIDDDAKTATVSYIGDYHDIQDIQAAVGAQGMVIDPAPMAAQLTSAPEGFCVHDLTEAFKGTPGIRRVAAARSGFELWVNLSELSVEKLFNQPFKFLMLTHEFIELSSASPVAPEQWEKFKGVLTETKGVLRVSASTNGLQLVTQKGKMNHEDLKKLAADRAELQVKVTTIPIKK